MAAAHSKYGRRCSQVFTVFWSLSTVSSHSLSFLAHTPHPSLSVRLNYVYFTHTPRLNCWYIQSSLSARYSFSFSSFILFSNTGNVIYSITHTTVYSCSHCVPPLWSITTKAKLLTVHGHTIAIKSIKAFNRHARVFYTHSALRRGWHVTFSSNGRFLGCHIQGFRQEPPEIKLWHKPPAKNRKSPNLHMSLLWPTKAFLSAIYCTPKTDFGRYLLNWGVTW